MTLPRDSVIKVGRAAMRNDVLLDISTFLARRWSGNPKVIITLNHNSTPSTKPDKGLISLPDLDFYSGSDFQKYRQWRVSLWYESMRMRYSSKVLSSEHAFGFLLNTIETKRIEILGLKNWRGMIKELIFYEGMSWSTRQLLNSIYGRFKIAEAFSQYFLTGYIKGELYGNEFDRVKRGADLANELVSDAIKNNNGTDWIEQHIPKLIKILEIDSLTSIHIPSLRNRSGIAMNQNDLFKQIEKIVKTRKESKDDPDKISRQIIAGAEILNEFETLVRESRKTENKGYDSLENFGLSIPNRMDIDESIIYDLDLIQKVKAAFRDWRTGWVERHEEKGDEFDVDTFVEGLTKTFLTDHKLSIKTKVAILLDHSSSIADVELEYKRATVALCESLQYLGIKFAVYAFSTESRQVKCWVIKPPNIKWSATSARRLAQIQASGGTPLAEIYGLLQPIVKSFKPDVMVTLTDGEPSDFGAVKDMVLSYRKMGIHMVSLGVGRNIIDSIGIGQNLLHLNYERSLAVSRLQEIPRKVINLLKMD